tara:strand:+ start:22860 stop:23105 length:246 start_codon:yes stop_codon:yes gene_type:complete
LSWFVYILKCNDHSLYTGITKDLNRRLKQHNAGKASKYTRNRLPTKIVYKEFLKSRSEALKREIEIKKLPKKKKIKLLDIN